MLWTDRHTNRQTNRQTALNITPTPTDSIGVGNDDNDDNDDVNDKAD